MAIEPDPVSIEAVEADIALVRAILQRDRKASAEFVRLYADPIYSYVAKRLAPRLDAADDLVQDIFLSAWSSLNTYSGAAPLRNWLLSIARHKIHDYYRRAIREALSLEDETSAEPQSRLEGIDEFLDRERRAAKAAGVLSQLRYEYALLLRWRYWDQMSAEQMAAETGRTPKAIERMLARARAQFQNLWITRKGG